MGYLLATLSALVEVSADFLSKRWSIQGGVALATLAIALYATNGALFLASLHYGKLTVLAAVWVVMVFVATSCIGIFVYHESINRIEFLALALGFCSILLFVSDEILTHRS